MSEFDIVEPASRWERVDERTARAVLECGCEVTLDMVRDHARLTPCGELHRDLAARIRTAGARWTVGSVPK